METPVYDFVTEYSRKNMSRLHMPGHKGRSFLGCEARDITEISGADVLHQAEGILGASQDNAAQLFGAGRTFYSTEGSSLCIKAMLTALVQGSTGTGRKYILAARNVHRSMVDACGLLDLELEFLTNPASGHLLASKPTPEQLRQSLKRCETLPIGVYVTSPDYLGNIVDVGGLSAVCREYDLPLVVDNAHGAYLRFLEPSVHPMQLGAAMCCDSAHKTLPVLTGGAYLHVASSWQEAYAAYVKKAMAVFGSTSPSYLILQSLDLCNRYLSEKYREKLLDAVRKVGQLKEILRSYQIPVMDTEPLKIVIDAAGAGYDGEEIAQEMREYAIECEYADHQFVVCMLTVENTAMDHARIRRWGEHTALRMHRNPVVYPAVSAGMAERVCSIREAVFHASETVPVEDAVGRICAAQSVACPPAVPIAVSGERITEEMVTLFQNYGIRTVVVLANP